MRTSATLLLVLFISLASQAADWLRNQPKTEACFRELGQNWAQALAAHETLLGEVRR